jgi:hypothetical protein
VFVKTFPQWLKAAPIDRLFGTTKVVPFQIAVQYRSTKSTMLVTNALRQTTSTVTAWFGGFPGLKIETGGTQVRGLAHEIIKSRH